MTPCLLPNVVGENVGVELGFTDLSTVLWALGYRDDLSGADSFSERVEWDRRRRELDSEVSMAMQAIPAGKEEMFPPYVLRFRDILDLRIVLAALRYLVHVSPDATPEWRGEIASLITRFRTCELPLLVAEACSGEK